jgi:hypothetical protein
VAEQPPFVVLTGLAASGKTSVAVPLAEALEVPLVSKDAIKEALFTAVGIGDLQWSPHRDGLRMTAVQEELAELRVAYGGFTAELVAGLGQGLGARGAIFRASRLAGRLSKNRESGSTSAASPRPRSPRRQAWPSGAC